MTAVALAPVAPATALDAAVHDAVAAFPPLSPDTKHQIAYLLRAGEEK